MITIKNNREFVNNLSKQVLVPFKYYMLQYVIIRFLR